MSYTPAQTAWPVQSGFAPKKFHVIVRTPEQSLQFDELAHSSIELHILTLERFGMCGVTVYPA